VIDPVSAYLRGVDDNRNVVVRGVLAPLNRLAEQLGAAVVLINHLTKQASANGKHRVLGSIAYVGACRANHLFVEDPHDLTGRRVLMLDNGGNLAARAPTLAYTIEEHENGPRVEWFNEPLVITVEEALRRRRETGDDAVDTTEASECRRWLSGLLANGPKSAVDVFKSANDAGYTRKQVSFAKRRIGGIARKQGFSGTSQWTWELPTQPFE
jgi:RecA-family ATPase